MLPPDLARLLNFVILDRNAPPGSWAEQRLRALRQVAMFVDQLRRDGLKGQPKQLLAEYEILNGQKSVCQALRPSFLLPEAQTPQAYKCR